MIFRRCASILALRYRGVGGEEAKAPQVKTVSRLGLELPTDGPDHTTRPKGHHFGQG